MKATAISNSNIAFLKYWGKKNIETNIPMNKSISMTLDENLSTKTTVEFSEKYETDILILNGKTETGNKLKRVSEFLDILRGLKNTKLRAKVVSNNTFPTGSGIASSASGFSALCAAAQMALGLNLSMREISKYSRLGSGSATRSVYGGFCEWENEFAMQIENETHWQELRDIVVIVLETEKKVGSRDAMIKTVNESKLYEKRLENLGKKVEKIKNTIIDKNFSELAENMMEDSDNMHACIREIGIEYLSEKSYEIKELIKTYNNEGIKAAYTFDAGPNAHVITTENEVETLIPLLSKYGKIIISKPGTGIKITENHLF